MLFLRLPCKVYNLETLALAHAKVSINYTNAWREDRLGEAGHSAKFAVIHVRYYSIFFAIEESQVFKRNVFLDYDDVWPHLVQFGLHNLHEVVFLVDHRLQISHGLSNQITTKLLFA